MSSPTSPGSQPRLAPSHSQQQQRNPISLRLYKVLGTNYSDPATREALQTLSDLYYTPAYAPGKGKERERDAEESGESGGLDWNNVEVNGEKPGQVKAAVHDLFRESVPGESASRARKNLGRDMQNKLAEGSRHFLKVFGQVDQGHHPQNLDVLQEQIQAMRRECDAADTQLQQTSQAGASLLERASTLRQERQDVEARKSIITLFLARFSLSEAEAAAITSRDVYIGPEFFRAMDRTERIRRDCRVLMVGEEGPSQAGLDIMAMTSTHLEMGYEKIMRWCLFQFRELGRNVHVEVEPTMREAIQRLRQRPELLSDALSTLSKTRYSTLHTSFITALTRGPPRPIELHAHDPLRYIGDMLAWVHQAIAAEREFLEALFGLREDGRMVGSVRTFGNVSEEGGMEEEWIRELMDGAVGGICGPLKARVLQTVRSQESSIIAYKIANLLQFYGVTMRRTIGDEAVLSKTLQDITDVACKTLIDAVETQGRALLRVSLDVEDDEVTPPLAILDHVQILREVTTVYESSLGDSLSLDHDHDQASFERIIDAMVDPAVSMCDAAAEEKKRVRGKWDREVFVLNCLTYLQGVLESFEFMEKKRMAIQAIVDQRVDELTEQHYENIRKDAGLQEVIVACETRHTGALSHYPATEPAQLQQALHKFSLWLSGPEVVHSPRLARLTAQKLHTQVHQAALERLARAYENVCVEVKRPENKYEAASTMLGSERPFGQAYLLFKIFGLEGGEEAR